MNCIAHRGFAGTNPENTLGAVTRAVAADVASVEVDVRRCGTGELVVIHDETVDRVTDGTGAVADLSLAALSSLSVLGSGEGVPTLSAVCEVVPSAVTLDIELKTAGLGADTIAIAGRHGCSVRLSSFDPVVLETIPWVDGAPVVDLALITRYGGRRMLDRAVRLGCSAVHPRWQRCTRSFVAAAQDRALAVNAWTVRSDTVARRLARVGVDGLIADHPEYCL